MIHCLIIKTSSLGDIIHTLPALTDAKNALGDIQFDWVVEESFREIPTWHPAVNKVLPVALRRWKKNFFQSIFGNEWKQFKKQIRAQHYDIVIDAQGLLKSALLIRLAKGKTYGFDRVSAREPIASHFYKQPQLVDKNQHAVERVRQLFAKSLGYKLPLSFDYGIKNSFHQFDKIITQPNPKKTKILFFHGTTWETKHWPEAYWLQLAKLLIHDGYEVILPWGNEPEKLRAVRIKNKIEESATAKDAITVLPKMTLKEIIEQLSQVAGVVAVDTGLAHLAAALDIPLVSLFGPTNPGLTRPYTSDIGKHRQLQVDYACIACLKRKCPLTINNNLINETDSDIIKLNTITPACFRDLNPNMVKQTLYHLLDANH